MPMTEPTPEKIEELRAILRSVIPGIVPAAADFVAAVQHCREHQEVPVALTNRCADVLVDVIVAAGKEGLLD